MNKIKNGDRVIVLCGAYKGRSGLVKKVLTDAAGKPEKAIVEGINMRTNFDRPNPQKNEPGGRILREAPIHASNLAPVHPETGKPMRMKIGKDKDGNNQRISPDNKEAS